MSDDIPIIDARVYRNPLFFIAKVHSGEIQLPVLVNTGNSSYRLTEQNMESIWLGIMMAEDWPEPREQ